MRERLSRYESPKKDSHNSHISPSKQDLSSEKIQRTKSLRKKSNRASGGHLGHPGISLEFSHEADKIEDYLSAYFPNGLPRSRLVTDRHSSYFNVKVQGHQICIAHLLRELTYLDELEPEEPWSKEMINFFKEAIHKRKTEQ